MPSPKAYQRKNRNNNAWKWIVFGVAVIALVVFGIAYFANQSTTVPLVAFPPREAGNPQSRVKVEMFADFQCPYCGIFARGVEKQIRSEFVDTGKILYIFRNFIVVDRGTCTESHFAAMAALCAGDQNQFWQYHDLLYANQGPIECGGTYSAPMLLSLAGQLNLDLGQFQQCVSTNAHQDVLDADQKLAESLHIGGTPSLFINGNFVDVAQGDDYVLSAIQAAVAANGG